MVEVGGGAKVEGLFFFLRVYNLGSVWDKIYDSELSSDWPLLVPSRFTFLSISHHLLRACTLTCCFSLRSAHLVIVILSCSSLDGFQFSRKFRHAL